ncbi:MAG: tal [Acidimicrobiia bacterium]|nr:tal [Acidimicrobiia bacterium]
MDRLVELHSEYGQSPWLDNLRRGFITSGELAKYRDRGIRGLTSNPTIFQKAIQGSADYDEQFRELVTAGGSIEDQYWALVTQDIRGALSVFEPVHTASHGEDGYVSVEVAPELARNTTGTVEAARHLHRTIDRPNLMVKIPATAEGVPAIQTMISDGRSINVTLIFSLDRYAEVMEAYISGLEQLAKDPDADLSQVSSVASFFISRVDVETDRRLEAIGTPEALALRGKAALAQGKLAYELFTKAFAGPRWEALAARGARLQRPLWASTSTKNPAYPDTLYVDNLIGPHTVNTLPDATIEAFADHGTLARTIDANLDEAHRVWDELGRIGVDVSDVARQLEEEGVSSFTKSFDELLTALKEKASSLKAG